MIKLYKLTDSCGKTWGGTLWGPGVSHSGTGEGGLCGPGWIHAYEHPLIAVLMNPVHANFKNPRLWEAEGEIAMRDGPLKCGCRSLTTVREIPIPEITTEMRVRFGILSAKEVCACLAWHAWADRWLSGEDRTQAAAEGARTLARAEAWSAAEAAEGAAEGARALARAEAWSEEAAAEGARALARAAEAGTDIFALAENACSGLM